MVEGSFEGEIYKDMHVGCKGNHRGLRDAQKNREDERERGRRNCGAREKNKGALGSP